MCLLSASGANHTPASITLNSIKQFVDGKATAALNSRLPLTNFHELIVRSITPTYGVDKEFLKSWIPVGQMEADFGGNSDWAPIVDAGRKRVGVVGSETFFQLVFPTIFAELLTAQISQNGAIFLAAEHAIAVPDESMFLREFGRVVDNFLMFFIKAHQLLAEFPLPSAGVVVKEGPIRAKGGVAVDFLGFGKNFFE